MLAYSLRDVRLGDVESDAAQRAIGGLQAGDALHGRIDSRDGGGSLRFVLDCGDGTHAMVRPSRGMNEKINRYVCRRGGTGGYHVLKADVGYVVRWYDNKTDREWKVALPRLILGR